jgi:transcriptional regulator with XRE-family HTH domain
MTSTSRLHMQTLSRDMTGQDLKDHMHDLRLSGRELARITGRDPTTISRYVQGHLPVPKELALLMRLTKESTTMPTTLPPPVQPTHRDAPPIEHQEPPTPVEREQPADPAQQEK